MFSTANSGYSLSDVAALANGNGHCCGNEGFGGNGSAWWIIILFLFCFMGWGNRGLGDNGNMGSAAVQGALTRNDLSSEFNFNDLQNSVRSIQSGISSLGYDQLSQMNSINSNVDAVNNNLNKAICQLGYNIQQGQNDTNLAILNSQNAQTIAAMQNQNELQGQISDCCCKTQSGMKDIQYQMATNTCSINTNNSNNARDIIDSQNANTRAVLEAIQQSKIDAMQDKIAMLTAQNNQLAFQASQQAQNAYLINELKPCPIPAYITCSPYQTYGFPTYQTCGCNN